MARFSQDRAVSDRITQALVAELETEFGQDAGAALAKHFLAAEESDFLWEARQQERWLGAYASIENDDLELDRVVIIGRIAGRWFVAQILIDGDGHAHAMLGRCDFRHAGAARKAFANAR